MANGTNLSSYSGRAALTSALLPPAPEAGAQLSLPVLGGRHPLAQVGPVEQVGERPLDLGVRRQRLVAAEHHEHAVATLDHPQHAAVGDRVGVVEGRAARAASSSFERAAASTFGPAIFQAATTCGP